MYIFAGCGFIGRNLVAYLVKNELASFIRVVDKTPPQLAWLNNLHMTAFNDNNVEFVSANLINEGQFGSANIPKYNNTFHRNWS